MANNCHFYVAGVVPFSVAKEYEERLCDTDANPRMWAIFVKPYVRLCTVKESCEKSSEMAEFFCDEYVSVGTEESLKLDAQWQADFDQLNDDSDDTAQSETSEPPCSAPQTSTNPLADMNAALKASLEQSQAALKASLAESQAALKKSLEDAMKGGK